MREDRIRRGYQRGMAPPNSRDRTGAGSGWALTALMVCTVCFVSQASERNKGGEMQSRLLSLLQMAVDTEAALIEATTDCAHVALVAGSGQISPDEARCSITLPPAATIGDADLPDEVREDFANLVVIAGMTSRASRRVCEHEATKSLCASPFEQSWLRDHRKAKPTRERLHAWAGETEATLRPLWTALCQLAARKNNTQRSCTS